MIEQVDPDYAIWDVADNIDDLKPVKRMKHLVGNTILPRSKMHVAIRKRPIIGFESLLFMGYPLKQLLPAARTISDNLLQDLAGNAFNGMVVVAITAAFIGSFPLHELDNSHDGDSSDDGSEGDSPS